MCREKLELSLPKTMAEKSLYICSFLTTSKLNGEYLQPGTLLETAKGRLHCPKVSWTLVYKRRKMEPSYLPSLRKWCVLLLCQMLAFVIGGHQAELNQSLRYVGKWARFANTCKKIGRVSSPKNGELKTAYILTIFNSTILRKMSKNRIVVFTHLQ